MPNKKLITIIANCRNCPYCVFSEYSKHWICYDNLLGGPTSIAAGLPKEIPEWCPLPNEDED